MRTFSCFIVEKGREVPSFNLIVASSLQRARELARRELLMERDGLAVEICEGSQLLWVETAAEADPARLAAR